VDQNNTVKSSSSGNNRKNILKNPSSLDFKIRTLLIDQSRVKKAFVITLSKNEMTNMLQAYFECGKNTQAAIRLYHQHFLNRTVPHYKK
jgi:hypothetical protein